MSLLWYAIPLCSPNESQHNKYNCNKIQTHYANEANGRLPVWGYKKSPATRLEITFKEVWKSDKRSGSSDELHFASATRQEIDSGGRLSSLELGSKSAAGSEMRVFSFRHEGKCFPGATRGAPPPCDVAEFQAIKSHSRRLKQAHRGSYFGELCKRGSENR